MYQALEIATEAERAGQEEMAAKRVLDKAAVKVGRKRLVLSRLLVGCFRQSLGHLFLPAVSAVSCLAEWADTAATWSYRWPTHPTQPQINPCPCTCAAGHLEPQAARAAVALPVHQAAAPRGRPAGGGLLQPRWVCLLYWGPREGPAGGGTRSSFLAALGSCLLALLHTSLLLWH